MKIRFIDDPGYRDQVKKRWSVKLMWFGGVFSAAWTGVMVVPGLSDHLPRWIAPACASVIFFCGGGAAFLKQPDLPPPPSNGVPPDGTHKP